jgi:PBP1b-binding outer membrane lipoprotein LpoB
MTRVGLGLVSLIFLAGCAQTQATADDLARRSAKAAVSETLVTRFPTVPEAAVTPFTDCIVDNSTAREIGEFAKDAVIGTSETTVSLIRGVLSRSETQTCVAREGLAALTAA